MAAGASPHFAPLGTENARRLMSAEHDLGTFWAGFHDPNYFRFAFVRDPYARAVSAFLDKVDSGRHTRFKKMLGFNGDQTITLLDFLRGISRQDVKDMNRHWRPQSALISPKVKLDFVGRFERFNEDFGAVLDRLDVDSSAVREKRAHQTSADSHLDLIGSEERALIERIYRDDFERFGYPMKL
jgi:hypothetical protein